MKKLVLLLLPLLMCCDPSGPVEETLKGEALGTTYSIKYFSEEDLKMKAALDSIFQRINESMSTYQVDSDISRVNRGDSAVRVDTMFQRVFSLSEKVHGESGGYFDPTVGQLVNLYGFGPEKSLREADSSTVDSLMAYVGLDRISIAPDGMISKEHSAIYLDFNAIAKGYAIDMIGIYLESREVGNYLVELGGELLARGENLSRGSPWTVGIDDPHQQEGSRNLKAALELRDRAMATSGNYRKTRIDPETGARYVHTINPLTGYPERSRLLSATVLAENCALADAYATAFMATGLDRSMEMLKTLDQVDAYFIYTGEDGEIMEFATEGLQEVLTEL